MAEQSYQQLRMDDVAARADVSKGTVYLYFDSKDALCAAIAVRRMSVLYPELQRVTDAASEGLSALKALLNHVLQHFDRQPHVFRVFIDWMQAPNLDDQSESFARYRERVAMMMGLLMKCIERGRADGSIRDDIDPLHQSLQIWASLVGLQLMRANVESLRKRIPHPDLDPNRLAPLHLQTMLRALEAHP